MKKKMKLLFIIFTITAMILTGCKSGQTSTSTTNSTSTVSTSDQSSDSTAQSSSATDTTIDTSTDTTSETMNAITSTTSLVEVDTEFTARDLDIGYEDSTATRITLDGSNIDISGEGATTENQTITISDEGTYVLTGTLTNGQIIVDAEDKDKVQIVLNGVSITCEDNSPIYIKNADKVFITLNADTINTLTDGTDYVQTDDNNADAVIFSKTDLTLNGEGTLNINGNYKHGIASKDDLIITGGTYNITAVKDSLNGKDSVKIKNGTFNLSATEGNGIQSKNSDDTTKGYVYICGGEITVSKCKEGIEGTVILITDGTINITAEDDGLNSASDDGSTSTDIAAQGQGGGMFENDTNCYIFISGGTLNVDASGDGIDSNGSLYVSGGTITVNGPTNDGDGPLDYNGTAQITGGTVMVAGSSGMAQGFGDTSTQYSLLYNLSSACTAGTKVTLTDSEGNIVVSFTPSKQYQSVVISSAQLEKDATYTLTCGDQTTEITLSSVVTSNGQQGMGGYGGSQGGGQGGGPGGAGGPGNGTPPGQ